MVYQYMVVAYAVLIENGRRDFDSIPEQYKVPVAEYLASKHEK